MMGSPSIYQELIPKRFDIRITIVGHRIFAVAIDSQSDPAATVDWRKTTNPHLPHHPIALPDHVEKQLLSFMEALGLRNGGVRMCFKCQRARSRTAVIVSKAHESMTLL
jgi:hypothetical protein